MASMKKFLKKFLTQKIINDFYHLPLAISANIVYGFPAGGLKVIGVTGTDGKTTTVNMVYQILKAAGKKVSMVSTINAVVGEQSFDTGFHVTSPGSFTIQKFISIAKESGSEYLILEVTSHALDQYRFWGVNFDVGIITNVTHEHLDYHKTFENYFETKLKLIQKSRVVVVNKAVKDSRNFKDFGRKALTFGISNGDFNQREVKLTLKVPGSYNTENALCAMGVAFVLGIDKTIAREALENFAGVAGRMEEVKNNRGFRVFIDFAHTPNGLEQALKALRSKSGRLISIIGAEGERDEGKRAMMGEIAQKLSNIVIVTALDPRGKLEKINEQIREGAEKAGAKEGINFFEIEDRKEAIGFALEKLARKGDVLGIFGKGHETSMNLDGKKDIPWSDREVIKNILHGL